MPHFTPEYYSDKCSDKVVYTTVDQAHSGSVDVGAFLGKLIKKDLCIGFDGYPKYVIIGEQTYSIMKNLKVKYYSDHYDWMYPVPGDWHLMKTAADVKICITRWRFQTIFIFSEMW